MTQQEAFERWSASPDLQSKFRRVVEYYGSVGVPGYLPPKTAQKPPEPAPKLATAAPPPSKLSATEQWDRAVSAKIAAGMTRCEAISALVAEQPELHKTWLREVNSRESKPEPPIPTDLDPLALGDRAAESAPLALFTVAVRRGMASGLSRGKAIAKVAREQPEVHAAYLQAVNRVAA